MQTPLSVAWSSSACILSRAGCDRRYGKDGRRRYQRSERQPGGSLRPVRWCLQMFAQDYLLTLVWELTFLCCSEQYALRDSLETTYALRDSLETTQKGQ